MFPGHKVLWEGKTWFQGVGYTKHSGEVLSPRTGVQAARKGSYEPFLGVLREPFAIRTRRPAPQPEARGGVCSSFGLRRLDLRVLANFDRHLHASLSSLQVSVQKVFRYVDDFLIVLEQDHHDAPTQFQEVYAKFCEVLNVFTLTKEYPENDSLRFLDLKLTCKQDHVCWEYAPRSKMGLLPFSSAHSKLIKRGVASAALGNALQRSCYHQVHTSFCSQVERLLSAGYPRPLLTGVAEKLLEKCAKLPPVKQPDGGRSRYAIMPYIHGVSHSIKRIAQRAGVRVVLSAPNKLGRLCRQVNQEKPRQPACKKNHATPFVQCKAGVVYEVPLPCGRSYIGQTGRCLNDRLREHAYSLRSGTGSNLALHYSVCDLCRNPGLDFSQCMIRRRYHDACAREIFEAAAIARNGASCVSTPSVALSEAELTYLRNRHNSREIQI